uniref:deacetylvindoline O-acetyltransferase-like n=1 Tax=Fragaria vesca subsp. vesca TaxID=101020 RepID=UPI0005CAEEFA|nr:PREDICTED: deacetylvindoline O-acetyltransferase-like [Fragaria vesca subsp. vesca]
MAMCDGDLYASYMYQLACTDKCIAIYRNSSSLSFCLKTWAAIALGVSGDHSHAETNRPEFISANLFPPKDLTGYINPSIASITKNKVTKRFVFDASNIEVLRVKYEGNAGLEKDEKHPSRVEVLSAFIWSRFVAVTKDTGAAEKLYMVIHAVNLRSRFDPPLPEHSFGNLYRVARKISINPSFLINSTYYYIRRRILLWSHKAGSPARTFKNLVHFLDTKEGDGIEAYICLEKEVMAKFETDSEFLAYVNPNDVC